MKHGQCLHYNSMRNALCGRGVLYKQFTEGLPCIQWVPHSARGGTYLKPGEEPVEKRPFPNAAPTTRCPFYEEPKDEDVQKERVEWEAHLQKTLAAIKVAGAWRINPKPAADRQEVVECPVCKGRLHLSQSSYNGHVHGKCETKDCVSWME